MRIFRVMLAAGLTTAAGLVAWSAVSRWSHGRVSPPPLAHVPLVSAADWKRRVLDATVMTESGGKFDAVNANTDGAGLSFGILQWAQKPGSLGVLLATMHARDPQRFTSIMGAATPELLAVTRAGGVAPVAGVQLWQEPWRARFKRLGADPVFQAVQVDQVFAGSYMLAAMDAARTLGGQPTERGMALLFDVAVQQGTGAVRDLARQAAPKAHDFPSRIRMLAGLAAARFRVTGAQPSAAWRAVNGGWHRFAGSVDLHKAVSNRTARILSSPYLSDAAVVLA